MVVAVERKSGVTTDGRRKDEGAKAEVCVGALRETRVSSAAVWVISRCFLCKLKVECIIQRGRLQNIPLQ
jgi:hypothetical protein